MPAAKPVIVAASMTVDKLIVFFGHDAFDISKNNKSLKQN